jgi:hypothetical protein
MEEGVFRGWRWAKVELDGGLDAGELEPELLGLYLATSPAGAAVMRVGDLDLWGYAAIEVAVGPTPEAAVAAWLERRRRELLEGAEELEREAEEGAGKPWFERMLREDARRCRERAQTLEDLIRRLREGRAKVMPRDLADYLRQRRGSGVGRGEAPPP